MTTTAVVPDRIEKQTLLRAPLARVWRAISDSSEFGCWFGARFDGPFVAGARLSGTTVPTEVDAEIAALQKPHEGTPFEMRIERVEPERHLSFRWHPVPVDPLAEFSSEPTTLVAFDLEPERDGVRLRFVESGYDALPAERRQSAWRENEMGWTMQMRLIEGWLRERP